MKRWIPRIVFGGLATILVGVVFHAPISVWLGSIFPDQALIIKAWKEILLGFVTILLIFEVYRNSLWSQLGRDWLVRLGLVFIALNIATAFFSPSQSTAVLAGLIINLRFVVFLLATYTAVKLYPTWRRPFVMASAVAAAISIGFAVLQVTVLPTDFLSHLGYGKNTIMPYLTVDQNYDYVRINGTLRGPNPLGLYAAIVFVLTTTFLFAKRHKWKKAYGWLVLLAAASLVPLWFSYSRSALLAWGVALLIFGIYQAGKKFGKIIWLAFGIGLLVLGGGIYLARDSSFVSHVIMHEDPDEGNAINSNDGHLDSLNHGFAQMLRQPFGAGIGSTGSPSLMMPGKGNIIENQYLYIAHETGWLGLGAFLALSCLVLVRLWRRRQDWLALGLFLSGVGIMLAGIVLPVWADDTVALVWWGLAGIALAGLKIKPRKKAK